MAASPRIDIPAWDDAHCHLGFLAAEERALAPSRLAARGLRVFSNTVAPDEFRELAFLQGLSIDLGLGIHPRFVDADPEAQLTAFDELLPSTRFVGEVGLDFGPAFLERAEAQRAVFTHIARACVEAGGRVLSIHAVRAAGEVLDILEESGVTESCTPVFHWFSGTSEELSRALSLGAFFSVGPRMLATRRGRGYAKTIPPERLLVETDFPPTPGASLGSLDELCDTMARAADMVEELRAPCA